MDKLNLLSVVANRKEIGALDIRHYIISESGYRYIDKIAKNDLTT